MSFLAPLFLLGAAAIVLPIVFHLIRRTSRDRMPFSSLMFLRPTPPRVTKRTRLENVFLLLLRCLAFCLLALAFARPFLPRPADAEPPSEPGKTLVLLVDTSASMRRDGLWPAAVSKAEELLNSASPADRVAVLTFDRQVRRLVNFEEWASLNLTSRGAETAGRLKELKPGWASTRLGDALTAAAETITDADKQGKSGGTRRIILISDLQEGSRLDTLQGYDWPRGVEVGIETVKTKRPTNAGLQWVVDAETAPGPGVTTGPRVRVSNSADAKREQFTIRWDGMAGTPAVDAYVPPGQSRILPAPPLPTNTIGERLILSGDDEDFDNLAWLVSPKPNEVKVAFVGSETEKDPAESLYYLKRAFQQTRRQSIDVTALPAGALSSTNLPTGMRLLIISGGLPEAGVPAAQQFLAGGGTVLFVMKNAEAARSLGQLANVENLAASEAGEAGYSMLGQIEFEHPLFAPFADPRFSDFTKVHFWKHRRLDAGALPDARVVARFDNSDPALLEIPRGKGRILVLTSGWNPADSQLALSSKFVPLMYSILDQAGGIQAQLTQFQVGDEVTLPQPGSGQSVTVLRPDGNTTALKPDESRFSETDLPGVYTVTSTQPPIRFAVNLDAAESRTAPLAADDLERLGVPLKVRDVELAKQLEQKRRAHDAELEGRQKLWRWLIAAALMVLLVETWLAGRLTGPAQSRAESRT